MAVWTKFVCPKDDAEFDVPWTFRRDVICPHCGTLWRTDVTVDESGNVTGGQLVEDLGPAPVADPGAT